MPATISGRAPNGEYFGQGYQVVATDGSLLLNQSRMKEPTMGATVMWHDAVIPHKSEQVGGQHPSQAFWQPIECPGQLGTRS